MEAKQKENAYETIAKKVHLDKAICAIGICIGLMLTIAGIILMFVDLELLNKALPGVMVGIGSGMFGGCIGVYISRRLSIKYPGKAHQKEIEIKDERNIMIRDRAKSKAFTIMKYFYCGLLLSLPLFDVNLR